MVAGQVQKAMSAGWAPVHGIESSVRETACWLVANRRILDQRQ